MDAITPTQARMARAALQLSLRAVAAQVGLSHSLVRRFERGRAKRSAAPLRLERYYRSLGIGFGRVGWRHADTVWREDEA